MAIGQKLEEARNRKGISIREASESTKIRGDYLTAFESSNFELGIPDVYLRGFVKLYSRFLDLDSDAILADLNLELGTSSRKVTRKSLGSISNSDSKDIQEYPKSVKHNSTKINKERDNLTKPLLIVLVCVVAFFITVGSLIVYFSNDSTYEQKNESNVGGAVREIPYTNQSLNQENESEVDNDKYTLKLSITGPTELLIIDDESNNPPKDFKKLVSGWAQNIEITKSFRCYCSNLENLRFAIDDGNDKKIDGSGPGNFSWNP